MVVAMKYVAEGAMFITHMNSLAGTDNLWKKSLHTLHTNEYSSP